MDRLKHDWLTEGLIDYEYKKYVLLAYLKDIGRRFNRSELYPFMSDLIFHYRNLIKVRESKKIMFESFPESLTEADFNKLKLTYSKVVDDDEVMGQIEEIIAFAIPKMKGMLEEGKELFEFVEENIELEPVGVSPIYSDEGYLFINQQSSTDVSIFRYQMTFFEHSEEKFRSMTTQFLMNEIHGVSKTYENIKIQLTKQFSELPNPATYLAFSKLTLPLNETVLPVAKRMLIQRLALS